MDALTSLLTYACLLVLLLLNLDSTRPLNMLNAMAGLSATRVGNQTFDITSWSKLLLSLPPTKQVAELAMKFNAMIDCQYELVDSEGIKNIYTNKRAVRFLEQKSFVSKIHQQTRDSKWLSF
jgi:hypothetical protein